jgi:hypothetical protein
MFLISWKLSHPPLELHGIRNLSVAHLSLKLWDIACFGIMDKLIMRQRGVKGLLLEGGGVPKINKNWKWNDKKKENNVFSK